MAEAVGFAADVAGLVLDRSAAGGAMLGDRAADDVDQRRAILVAVQRNDAAGLDDQPAGAQLAAVDADFRAEVDRADARRR